MPCASVSVVTPCFNQGRFLGEALDSVFAQTLNASQVVVVDDGSTDQTATIARRYAAVTYVRQSNQGLARARNRGLDTAVGDYVVFLDADDRLLPEALATGIEELAAHPDCAFVFGRCERIDDRGSRLPTVAPPVVEGMPYETFLRCNPIWTPAIVMFRRSGCGDLLRFNPKVNPSADYDVYLRIARSRPVRAHGRLVAEYRLHAGCMSSDPGLMLRSTVQVLRAQRRQLDPSSQLRAACDEGLRGFRHHYSERLVAQMRTDLRTPHRWTAALKRAAILARFDPAGLLRHLYWHSRAIVGSPAEPLIPRAGAGRVTRVDSSGNQSEL
jgi:hypothetical protein